ncbi:MAG: D-alanyl-D-alanine carboxypeptidase [Clostridia bacterium]|nr:D-alanyl-D-alanine carboxypeptidase [Clostridia bacterium]
MKRLLIFVLTLCLLCSLPVVALCAEESDAPAVQAKAAVLLEQESGTLLLGQNEHEKLYPASVTKVMSLLLFFEALERGDLSLQTTVTASAEAAKKGGSQIWLKEGEQMSVDELLRATAIGSANDACTALAEALAGSEQGFVRRMNERAKQLGMNDTHFDNCTGLDDDTTTHLTSAYDVALMSRALLSHEKVLDYTTVWMDSLRGGQTQLVNTNKLVRHYKDTTGLKTGTTSKAGCCISASAKRGGMHLIAVILGAENSADRFAFAQNLLDWGFASFEAVTPEVPQTLLAPLPVQRGKEAFVLPKLQTLPALILRRGEKQNLNITADMAEHVEAPVEKGQTLGTLTFSVGDKQVAKSTLCAASDVGRLTLFDVFLRLLASLARR